MDTPIRRTDLNLEQELLERGFRFEFFQSVRLLGRLYADRQPVGAKARPADEIVRFRAHQSLAFPPSSVFGIRAPREAKHPAEMTIAFMGLTGPQGVLPRCYTELILDRLQAKDTTLRDFLDLFNHRMVSLFFRAWEKHQCFVGFEQSLLKGREDRFAHCLFALAGLGTQGLREQLTIDDHSVLRYVGLLGQRPRSADALSQCLTDYFQVPVAINQFMGAWLTLDEGDWTRIGASGANNLLGKSALAGRKVWDQQSGFRVKLGPLEFEQFDRLLPSGKAYPTLVQLTKLFAGPELDFDVQLIMKREEVPAARLGETPAYSPRLGWTTWLKTKEFTRNADEVRFPGSSMMAQAGTA
jgi:type VI secretion system protein ImpH